MIDKIKDYKQIYDLFKKYNYVFFNKKAYDLNIFAIRSKNRIADSFDDVLGCAYLDDSGKECLFKCWCTVDPGNYYLKNLMDSGGAAAIVPGQYKKVWQLGYFKGTHALMQIRPFHIFRDKNKDNILDFDKNTITSGIYGIFLHESFQKLEEAHNISNSSAGCVVPKIKKDYQNLIRLCYKQIYANLGDVFTFTLFDEDDL